MVRGCQYTHPAGPVMVVAASDSESCSASSNARSNAASRRASRISAIWPWMCAIRAWNMCESAASSWACSVSLYAGTSPVTIRSSDSRLVSMRSERQSSSFSPVYSCENAPVTARAADDDPRRATVEISGRLRSSPAASQAAIASAAKPDDDDPNPTFDGKEFSDSTRTRWSNPARSRTWSTTWSIRSAPRPATRSPSIRYSSSSASGSNATVVRVCDGAVQTLMLSWYGNRRSGSRIPWYFTSPWIGCALAVAFMYGRARDAGLNVPEPR